MAEERITIAKPVWSQMRITMRKRLFHGCESHQLGSEPNATRAALRMPICSPKPSGRKA
jgi:hypothetical protein